MRRIAVLDAPSNLGLRPPTATSVPGCAKAPGALRDHGLLRRLNARDAGCLTPPRYDPGDWRPGDGVCHAAEIGLYSRRLADRIGAILDLGEFPVILGGDCSILLGSALAMHRLGEAVGGRIGLVFVDGHSDFRHPGNASYVGAAAGEDLALVTGRGQPNLAAIEGRRPYYRDIDVIVLGIRPQDEYRLDLQAAGIVTRPVPTLRVEGAARSAQWARDQLVDCAGYWVHIDVDVLDPAVMPAVDAPEPGGIAFPELELLLAGLVESPHCLGVEITVFDPDYDPDGRHAEEITSAIVAGLQSAHTVELRPDLIAARRDLNGPGLLAPAAVLPPAAADTAAEAQQIDADPAAALGEDAASGHATGLKEGAEQAPVMGLGEDTGPEHAVGPEHAAGLGEAVEQGPVADREHAGPEAAEPQETASRVAEPEAAELEAAEVETAEPETAEFEATGPESVDPRAADPQAAEPEPEPEPVDIEPAGALVDIDGGGGNEAVAVPGDTGPARTDLEVVAAAADPDYDEVLLRAATRPLGSAPLLDSKPLPATMPGMLRPRAADEITLPTQRPAFEVGPEQPADLT